VRRSRRAVLTAGVSAMIAPLAGCSGGSDGSDGSDGSGSTGDSGDGPNPTVSIIEPRSGGFAVAGTPKWQASRLAFEEINEQGGIMGEEVEIFDPDPQSKVDRTQQLVRRAIREKETDALWCAVSSATRAAVRPITTEFDQLYFYTQQHEGGVCDKNVFIMGCVPSMQITPLMEHMVNNYGNTIYTIAADYNFGQISAKWVKKLAQELDAEVLAEEFIPVSVSDFSSTIGNIQDADPDFVFSLLGGNNHASFYKQRSTSGLEKQIATTTHMVTDYSHIRLDSPALADVIATGSYMEEVDVGTNNEFITRFYNRWPDAEYIAMDAYNNYFSAYMYKNAVEQAGTFEQEAVKEALRGVSYEAPLGEVSIDAATQHCAQRVFMVQADDQHNVELLQEPTTFEPTWLRDTIGCNLQEEAESHKYTPTV